MLLFEEQINILYYITLHDRALTTEQQSLLCPFPAAKLIKSTKHVHHCSVVNSQCQKPSVITAEAIVRGRSAHALPACSQHKEAMCSRRSVLYG